MKTIVYLEDGSTEATNWADKHVASGIARYATPEEIVSYERNFARDDARIAANARLMTPAQILWASSHDWFVRQNPDRSITVRHELDPVAVRVFHNFAALKIWAGY